MRPPPETQLPRRAALGQWPGVSLLTLLLAVAVTSAQDTNPPVLISVDTHGNPNGVTVVYSKPMDAPSSTDVSHYGLTNSTGAVMPVTNAALAADSLTVQLQLGASLQVGGNYTLVIGNVLGTNGYPISPNPTLSSFVFGGPTYTFDDGQVPAGTTFPTGPDASGNAHNPGSGVTAAGGLYNSGMLTMTAPATGQTFAQWRLPDLANGQAITNLSVSFNLFVGGGSGGNAAVRFPPPGGNGLLFHWGPGLLYQYTGGASSWGRGLDVTLRTYNSGVNTPGINIYYGGTAGPGANSPVATSSFLDYYQGATTDFSSNTWVSLNLQVVKQGGATNAILSLVCSNNWNGLTNIYSNRLIPNFTMPLSGQPMAFTATDGSGAHEYCLLDSVDFTINGSRLAGSNGIGPVAFTLQPLSQTVLGNAQATFKVAVSGAPPFTYQWLSNGLPIAGANASSYTTPPTTFAMNGTLYSVMASNYFSGAVSSNATLTVVQYPVTITDQPASQTVPAGSTATLAVALDPNSSGPISYQWWRVFRAATNPIAGATSASYTTPPLTVTDSGTQFFAVVSGALNTVTSAVAVVTVLAPAQFAPPVLAADGTNLTLAWSNGGFLLSATNLTGPWFRVAGATNSPYTFPITPGVPQQFFRVQQFGTPGPAQDYTPYVNVVQNANGQNGIHNTALLRYPCGRIGLWSVDQGEFADCVTRALRLYPCIDTITNKGTVDWRNTVSGTPSAVTVSYRTDVPAQGSAVDLTVTPHVSVYRFHFAPALNFRAVTMMVNDLQIGNLNWTSNSFTITDGQTIQATLGKTNSSRTIYYYIKFSAPCIAQGTINGLTPNEGATSIAGNTIGGYFKFNAAGVTAAIAVSHTSMAQAKAYFDTEFSAMDFNAAALELKNAWIARLGRVEAQGPSLAMQQLYTALYTVYVNLIDASDNPYYTSYKPLLTIASSDYWQYMGGYLRCDWDMSRGVYQLVALIDPEVFTHILNTYQAQYDRDKPTMWCNWDPFSASGFSVNLYVPNFAVLASLQGINGVDFNKLKNSLTNHVQHNYRPEFFTYKYIPSDSGDVNPASHTLEYSPHMQGLAILGRQLGDTAVYNYYYPLRTNYLNLFDASNQQFRTKMASGAWGALASDFFEGTGVDYGFAVPHDPYGVLGLYGPSNAVAKIDNYIRNVSDFNDYKLIYEFLPTFADRADVTASLVRTVHVPKFNTLIMSEGFWPGSRGCYYTDNAGPLACCLLGLYFIPTSGATWMLSAPSLDRAVIHGKTDLTIQTLNNSPTNNYVSAVQLNGAPYPGFLISGKTLVSSSQTITVSLTNSPAKIGNLYLSSTDGEILSIATDNSSYLDFDIDPMAASCRAEVYSAVPPASITLNGAGFTNWVYDPSTKLAFLNGLTLGSYRVQLTPGPGP